MSRGRFQLEAVDPGADVIPGWNKVLNRSLPWFAAETEDQRCFAADLRCTVSDGHEVVGIAERSHGQVLVAVDPAHRNKGLGTWLGELVDPGPPEPVTAFSYDPTDPAAQVLWRRHRLKPQPGRPLVLWSLDTSGVSPPAGDVSVWRPDHAQDLDEIRQAVRWWATDNDIDEDGVRAWQEGLPGELVTTVAREAGRVVGVAWAQPIPFTDLWRSTHLAVSPEHRGRGLGLALKRGQAVHAASCGARGLVTQIDANSRANAIWLSLGGQRRDLPGLAR